MKRLLRLKIIKLFQQIILKLELRIMAHISGDEGLIDAFNKGLDIHKATAAEVLGIPLENVFTEQRRQR